MTNSTTEFPTIRTVIDQIRPILPEGFRLVVSYNGSDDSGWFEDYWFEDSSGNRIDDQSTKVQAACKIVGDNPSAIHEELYKLLGTRFPGWEIGDGHVIGSHGYFTINSKNNRITQNHYIDYNDEQDESPDEEVPF